MSPPPDGVFVSTPRIVGWTERTNRLYVGLLLIGFLATKIRKIGITIQIFSHMKIIFEHAV